MHAGDPFVFSLSFLSEGAKLDGRRPVMADRTMKKHFWMARTRTFGVFECYFNKHLEFFLAVHDLVAGAQTHQPLPNCERDFKVDKENAYGHCTGCLAF